MALDKQVKQFPVKILDNLYVYGIIGASEEENNKFLNLDEVDQMECLMKSIPSIKQSKFKAGEEKYFIPTFGDFSISTSSKDLLKFYNIHFTEKKSKDLFEKFTEEYLNMISCYKKLEKWAYERFTL